MHHRNTKHMRDYEVIVHARADPRTGIAPPRPRYPRPSPPRFGRVSTAGQEEALSLEFADAVRDRRRPVRTPSTVAALTAAAVLSSRTARNAQAPRAV
ncbi:hypothetical protein ACN9M0_00580 [Streptomyces sp. R-07]|uniref:YxiG-like protein n=1 Tax=Streptomyces sp. R-07 TaxID=3404052 RepID=UPI003CF5CC12